MESRIPGVLYWLTPSVIPLGPDLRGPILETLSSHPIIRNRWRLIFLSKLFESFFFWAQSSLFFNWSTKIFFSFDIKWGESDEGYKNIPLLYTSQFSAPVGKFCLVYPFCSSNNILSFCFELLRLQQHMWSAWTNIQVCVIRKIQNKGLHHVANKWLKGFWTHSVDNTF